MQDGFYEGLIFHRVINNFGAQGGGYTPDHVLREPTRDPVPNEAGNGLSNLRGTVGMASAGGLIAVVIANIAAIILVRMIGKNLTDKP